MKRQKKKLGGCIDGHDDDDDDAWLGRMMKDPAGIPAFLYNEIPITTKLTQISYPWTKLWDRFLHNSFKTEDIKKKLGTLQVQVM